MSAGSYGRRDVVLAAMCAGLFLVFLDVTSVNVALPSMEAGLGGGVSTLQWVVDAYALSFASLLLAGGALGDRFGHRRMVLGGLAVFGAASAVCGFAPQTAWLVAGRALQGVGAALLLPGTLAVIVRTHPERTVQARAIGIWSAVGGLALPVGPLAGGVLVSELGWQSIFLIPLPVVLAALAATAWLVPDHAGRAAATSVDVPGLVLAVMVLGAFTFACIESGPLGWSSPWVLAGVVLAALALVTLAQVERRVAGPLLPPDLLRSRAFRSANFIAWVMNCGAQGTLFLLTLFLQDVQRASPLGAGLRLAPMFVALVVVSPLGGRWVARGAARVPAMSGLMIAGAGLLLLSRLESTSPYGQLVLPLVAIGAGLGVLTPAVVAAAMAARPSGRAGLASGVNNAARQAGNAIGVAIMGALAGDPGHGFVAGMRVALLLAAALYGAAMVVGWLELSG